MKGTRRNIMEFIKEFYLANGCSPSIREIGEAVGISSTSTVHFHIKGLIEDGKLKKIDCPGSPRALIIHGLLKEIQQQAYKEGFKAGYLKAKGEKDGTGRN